ncbi:HNH endonuclease [Streptomyces sp. B1866]|uniref:HNH endonuclease n=1 Tax=Streptomyces sp. B1866 TaxID=3075431 RepID=UPI00288DAD06|nr:HNH endonuclease [Streptomyces sp. B1866]MDT3397318.1 HNH endonuclease [Streptomyces sp. B1866]
MDDECLPSMPSLRSEQPQHDDQLALFGQPQRARIPTELWQSWLDDPAVAARFEAKRYRRSEHACWIWTAGISSTGHGTFRAASLPGRSRRGTVPAHLFAYQFEHGVIPRLGWSEADDPCLCHRCDEAGCVNPSHLRLGTNAENRAEWAQRHRNPHGPLADLRGAAGRARAVAAAIRAGIIAGEDPAQIEQRIQAARDEGRPLTLW